MVVVMRAAKVDRAEIFIPKIIIGTRTVRANHGNVDIIDIGIFIASDRFVLEIFLPCIPIGPVEFGCPAVCL